MQLHDFHSSSASFRVRIALALKGLSVERVGIPILDGRAQLEEPYRSLNPQAVVPTLVDGAVVVRQSLAIIEYLEELHPAPPLLPRDAAGRARVRSIAQAIACEIQPLNNLRADRYLGQLGLDGDARRRWRQQWIATGFAALEVVLGEPATGQFCHGDGPTLADCFLAPQVFNARRPYVGLDLSPYPRVTRIADACMALPAFAGAAPQAQADYEEPPTSSR